MNRLAVIGNVSRDQTRYPDGRGASRLGGAALHVTLAATGAGLSAGPVCVLGRDLTHLPTAPGLGAIDWTGVVWADGASATFLLDYDTNGELRSVKGDFGVADQLTEHALTHLHQHPDDFYHVCCRRPLDPRPVLEQLAARHTPFSVDFFLPSAEQMIRSAAPWLPYATTVFVNAAEHRLLTAVVDPARLPEIVVTDGPRPVRIRRYGRYTATVTPPPCSARDVVGAGDTLAGTYLARRACGAPPDQALTSGVGAAARHITAHPILVPNSGHVDSNSGGPGVRLHRPPALRRT